MGAAKKRGRFHLHPFKSYKEGIPFEGFFSNLFTRRLMLFIRKRGTWAVKDAIPRIDTLIDELENHLETLKKFNAKLLEIEIEKSHSSVEKERLNKLNGELNKYDQDIKAGSRAFLKKLGELMDILQQAFLDLEVTEDSGHGMQFKSLSKLLRDKDKIISSMKRIKRNQVDKIKIENMKRLKDLGKNVLKIVPKADIENVKEKMQESISIMEDEYSKLLLHVNARLEEVGSKVLSQIKVEYQGSKRQARRFMEPRVAQFHQAEDQLARDIKVLAKDAVALMNQELQSVERITNSQTFHEFRAEFDNLIKLYEENTHKLHELIEWVKVLFYRLEKRKKTLEEVLKVVTKNQHVEHYIGERIREVLHELHQDINSIFGRLEVQSRLLQNEINKMIKGL